MNVAVVRSVVEAAAGRMVVFAGSTSQVGSGARQRVDGTETDVPTTEYDRQKCEAERVVLESGGISLRLPTVYGPTPLAVDRGVVTTMIRRALAGERLTVWGDGLMERDLVFVDDVANAFVEAVIHADRTAGRHWLLGTGRGVTVRELFETVSTSVSAHTGKPPVPVVSVPPPREATVMDVPASSPIPPRSRRPADGAPRRRCTPGSPRPSRRWRNGNPRTEPLFRQLGAASG